MEISNTSTSVSAQPLASTNSSSTENAEKNTVSEKERIASLPHPLAELKLKQDYELDPSEKVIIQAIEKANKALMGTTTNLKFSIHEKTKEIMVKVINSETNEVMREIPPEKTLDMVAKMMELSGLIIDEKR